MKKMAVFRVEKNKNYTVMSNVHLRDGRLSLKAKGLLAMILSLPDDWNILPHGKATQDFGKAWLEEKEFPFLKVPSSRVSLAFYPLEHNLLINPDFPSISELVKVVETVPFDYLLNSPV